MTTNTHHKPRRTGLIFRSWRARLTFQLVGAAAYAVTMYALWSAYAPR